MDHPPSYVAAYIDPNIVVKYATPELEECLMLKNIPFIREPQQVTIAAPTKELCAAYFALLRDAGCAFSAGREWSPIELFAYYKELGLLSGRCLKIVWSSPDQWKLIEHTA